MLREDVQRLLIFVINSLIICSLVLSGGAFFQERPSWWPARIERIQFEKRTADHLLLDAGKLSSQFRESDLARIFLTNSGQLPQRLRQELQTTGLLHLLAISAGQLLPVLALSHQIMSRALLIPSQLSIPLLSLFRLLGGFIITFALSILYGLTGSLVRVILSLYTNRFIARIGCVLLVRKWRHASRIQFQQKTRNSTVDLIFETLVLDPFFSSCLIIGIIALFGRNLLTDWSFLYASIGAQSCALGAQIVRFLKSYLLRLDGLIEVLITLIIIQLIVTLIIWPLSPVNIPAALLANILIGPIVAFIVVPATVTLTILSALKCTEGVILSTLVSGLIFFGDFGLILFRESVSMISEVATGSHKSLFRPFSQDAYCYTIVVVISFWIFPSLVYLCSRLIRKITSSHSQQLDQGHQ